MTTTRIKWFLYLWSKHRITEGKIPPHPSSNFSWTGHRKDTEDSPCSEAHAVKPIFSHCLCCTCFENCMFSPSTSVAPSTNTRSINKGLQGGLERGVQVQHFSTNTGPLKRKKCENYEFPFSSMLPASCKSGHSYLVSPKNI